MVAPPMTTRRWMIVIVVAYLAILLTFLIAMDTFLSAMDRRVAYLVRAAEYHEKQAALANRGREEFLEGGLVRGFPPTPKETRLREFHKRMAEKYRQAAWHPWLSVEPDPMPPEP